MNAIGSPIFPKVAAAGARGPQEVSATGRSGRRGSGRSAANLAHLEQLAALAPKLENGAQPVASELLEMGDVVAESVEGLDRIARIVEDLLHFARPPLERRSPVSLNRVAEEALRLAALHQGSPVRVEAALAPALPAVEASEDRLMQVALNLLLNARQALGAREGGWIRVETGAEAGRVTLRVRDNGPGVPRRAPRADLRPVLHHAAARRRHGARPRDRLRHRARARREPRARVPDRRRRLLRPSSPLALRREATDHGTSRTVPGGVGGRREAMKRIAVGLALVSTLGLASCGESESERASREMKEAVQQASEAAKAAGDAARAASEKATKDAQDAARAAGQQAADAAEKSAEASEDAAKKAKEAAKEAEQGRE